MKFPSQNKIVYQTGAMSNDAFSLPTSGGVQGYLNTPKDLSLLNRRGYASTTRKGVPLIYRTMFKIYQHDEDGKTVGFDASDAGSTTADTDAETIAVADFSTILRVSGCQNNWVAKNAAVKWHAAREALWKAAGISKRDIGAWAKEVRYSYNAYNNAWLVPVDGDGAAFAGGTWDLTPFVSEDDPEFMLKLVGSGVDEDVSFGGTELNFMFSYLSSRGTVPADSNLETSDVPATNSKLQQILNWRSGVTRAEMSYIQEDVDDVQDNPPYAAFGSGSTTHDITEPVELGRAVAGQGPAFGSVICDVPFGIAEVNVRHSGASDQNISDGVHFSTEILDIYPMQG